jgi:predicted house-cleaning noncanonical NTP pyrophosphatase (MazG superfamily)
MIKNKKSNVFNKLVRDFIPDIIKAGGSEPIIKTLSKSKYKKELINKLLEEAQEFKENPCVEEAADLLEVLDSLFKAHNLDKKDIIKSKKNKKSKRGGFSNRVFLVKTYD